MYVTDEDVFPGDTWWLGPAIVIQLEVKAPYMESAYILLKWIHMEWPKVKVSSKTL
jgi:hypothetical protein